MKQNIAEAIVDKIIESWENGYQEDNTILEKLTMEFSMSYDDAEMVLELTRIGIFRASIIAGGEPYPKSNLWDDQIVDTAFKKSLAKLGKSEFYAKYSKRNNKWWKFWK